VIDDASIDLLGHALVEAAVSGFHVEDGDFAALRCDRGQTTIRIASTSMASG